MKVMNRGENVLIKKLSADELCKAVCCLHAAKGKGVDSECS